MDEHHLSCLQSEFQPTGDFDTEDAAAYAQKKLEVSCRVGGGGHSLQYDHHGEVIHGSGNDGATNFY